VQQYLHVNDSLALSMSVFFVFLSVQPAPAFLIQQHFHKTFMDLHFFVWISEHATYQKKEQSIF